MYFVLTICEESLHFSVEYTSRLCIQSIQDQTSDRPLDMVIVLLHNCLLLYDLGAN